MQIKCDHVNQSEQTSTVFLVFLKNTGLPGKPPVRYFFPYTFAI